MAVAEIIETEGGCILKRASIFSGNVAEMFLPVDWVRVQAYLSGMDRRIITTAFPELNPGQREFIMTGCTPGEWDAMMGDPDDPEDD